VTLLDSLHEETNIRLKKPYIENPSSHKRKEEELMYEYWSNFLMRNWSFFIFVFYGQMRSYIKCMECNTERISYEVFSTLSLPLPDATSVLLYINFIRIP
jgi:ubiquitin C-terminal hydrolase